MTSCIEPRRHTFSRTQFECMIDHGIFAPEERLELLEGELLTMSPQKSQHATAVTLVGDALRAAFGADVTVRIQLPLILDDASEPEPDVAVVPGQPRAYRDTHPDTALLICEISDTTLQYDRGRKQAAYARAGIPEYWILNLNDPGLDVYRQPSTQGYLEQLHRSAGTQIAPLARPAALVNVSDLLP